MHTNTKMMIVNAARHCKDFVYNLLYFAEHSPTDGELPYLRNCVLSLKGAKATSTTTRNVSSVF